MQSVCESMPEMIVWPRPLGLCYFGSIQNCDVLTLSGNRVLAESGGSLSLVSFRLYWSFERNVSGIYFY